MKRIVIIIGAILFIVILSVYFFVINKKNQNNSDISSSQENKESLIDKTQERITIETNEGTVQINNIYKEGGELFKGGITFKESSDYYISFDEVSQSFSIAIMNAEDLYGARARAEEEFVRTLGITNEQACKLKVDLGVPYNVNPQLPADNYGLSFCPNGKDFDAIKGL